MKRRTHLTTRLFLPLALTCSVSVMDTFPVYAQAVQVSPIPSVRTARLKTLLEQLRTADRRKRSQIIREIRLMGPSTVPDLRKALDSNDPFVLSGVSEALGWLGDAAAPATPKLIKLLDNSQRWLLPTTTPAFPRPVLNPVRLPREVAKPQRVFIPPPPANRRLPRLRTAQPESLSIKPPSAKSQRRVRKRTRRKPTPLKPLKKPYYRPPNNPEMLVRVTAAATLGNIGVTRRSDIQPELTKALNDPNPWMQLTSAWALNQIGSDVPTISTYLKLLQHPQANVRRSTAYTLTNPRSLTRKVLGANRNTEVIEQFVQRLGDTDVATRSRIRLILKDFGNRAMPPLSQLVTAGDALTKLEALRTLSQFRRADETTIKQLTSALADRTEYQPSSTPFSAFLSPLPSLPSPRLFGRPRSYVPNLFNSNLVRTQSAMTIGKLRPKLNPELRKALLTGMTDDTASMRLASSWALMQLRPSSFDRRNAIRVIASLIEIPDRRLSRDALGILNSSGKPASPYLTTYWRNQLQGKNATSAILALGRLGASALPAVPDLRQLLTGKNKVHRGYSATVLAKIARAMSRESLRGNLPAADRERALIEFRRVLNILEKPGAKFNRAPITRLRRAIRMLEKNSPTYPPLQRT